MADLVVTAANVIRGARSKVQTGIAGASVTAGEPWPSWKPTTGCSPVPSTSFSSITTRTPIYPTPKGCSTRACSAPAPCSSRTMFASRVHPNTGPS